MTTNSAPEPPTTESTHDAERAERAAPLLAEDVMLVLLSPHNGTIGGEGTLFYVLGGAVLAELATSGAVEVEEAGLRGTLVSAVGEPPADPLLLEAWTYCATKPRGAQTMLAAIGPKLREPVLERLVASGEVSRETRKVLGPITRSTLEVAAGSRRAGLVEQLRAVLVDGAEPTERIGAIGALVSASGALPTLDKEIPWGSDVAARSKALEKGDWGAGAAAQAVTRTTIAIAVNSVAVSVAIAPR